MATEAVVASDTRVAPGDRFVVKGHHVGEPDRDAKIIEVQGADGGPPYLVEWSDDGHVGLVFPGPDAYVEHFSNDEGSPGTEGTPTPS